MLCAWRSQHCDYRMNLPVPGYAKLSAATSIVYLCSDGGSESRKSLCSGADRAWLYVRGSQEGFGTEAWLRCQRRQFRMLDQNRRAAGAQKVDFEIIVSHSAS